MFVRNLDKDYFFISPDYEEKVAISVSKEFPFNIAANRTDIYFEFDDNSWKMRSRNPKIKINE
jgi:hypothetical protein